MEKNKVRILVLLLLVTLLVPSVSVVLKLTQATNGTDHYDFIEHASDSGVIWESGVTTILHTLSFGGSPGDDRGFAIYVQPPELEDLPLSRAYDRVMETHPKWVRNGYIRGTYPETTVVYGTELVVSAGFLKDAVATDGVIFQVAFCEAGAIFCDNLVTFTAKYDGRLDHSVFDLKDYAGRRGRFVLVVTAGESSSQDWAVWAKAEIRPRGTGDLKIVTIEPVQVLYGAPLIRGKNTAFRVRVFSSFSNPVETLFRLVLPDDEWDTPEAPPYPEIWGPAEIPPSSCDYEVMLPYIPENQINSTHRFRDNPAGILVSTGDPLTSFASPNIRLLPRPAADEVAFTVELDPDNRVSETDEMYAHVMRSDPQQVSSTKSMELCFVPYIYNLERAPLDSMSAYEFYLRERGYQDRTNRIQRVRSNTRQGSVALSIALASSDINRLKREARRYTEHFLGTFPIADLKITYKLEDTLYFIEEYLISKGYNPCSWDIFKAEIRDKMIAAYPSVDVVIFFTVFSCGGQTDESGCFVDAGLELQSHAACWWHRLARPNRKPSDSDYLCIDWKFCYWQNLEYAMSHELCHYFLKMPGECYACWESAHPQVDCSYCDIGAEGFWTYRWKYYPRCTGYFMHGGCGGCDFWNRLEPSKKKDGTLNPDGYLNAIKIFASSGDPDAIMIRGSMTRDGNVAFDPFMVVPNATLDVRLGPIGDFYLVSRDLNGSIISKLGFNVSFYAYVPPPNPPQELDSVYFNYRIPWREGTHRIELLNRNDIVLASKTVSPHKPKTTMTYPNGGEVFTRGDTMTIKWNASDEDLDYLTYSLSVLKQGEDTWRPIDIDITEGEYEFSTMFLEGNANYRIRVVATDGINTVEDISDATFHVKETTLDMESPYIEGVTHEPTEPNNLQTVAIRANVTDEQSGVKTVTMSYSTDNGTTWKNATMEWAIGDACEVKIPSLPAETKVQYQIIAYDNAGNFAVDDNFGQYYTYAVQQSPLWMQWWFWTIPALIILALVGMAYFLIKRKPKTPTTPASTAKTNNFNS